MNNFFFTEHICHLVFLWTQRQGTSLESRPCCRPTLFVHFPKEEFQKAVKKFKEFLGGKALIYAHAPVRYNVPSYLFTRHSTSIAQFLLLCPPGHCTSPDYKHSAVIPSGIWHWWGAAPWVLCVVSNHTSPNQLDCGLLYIYPPVSLVICIKPAGNLNIIFKYSKHY